jgi:hypothetical protein
MATQSQTLVNVYQIIQYIGCNLSASGGYVPVTYTGVMHNKNENKKNHIPCTFIQFNCV